MSISLLALFCAILVKSTVFAKLRPDYVNKYTVLYDWYYLNFTWTNSYEYEQSLMKKKYIPENVIVTSIKIHGNYIYMALPRIKDGVPITLATVPLDSKAKNPILSPFPSWGLHDRSKCKNLQSVHAIEIDPEGTVWAVDSGSKFCDPALFLISTLYDPPLYTRYNLPGQVANRNSVLNDIVVDNDEKRYAYITDGRANDPGIIVFSLDNERFWRFKHKLSMTAAKNAANFFVNPVEFDATYNINGITLGPRYFNKFFKIVRNVYYSPLSSRALYATTTEILRNNSYSTLSLSNDKNLATKIGTRSSQSSSMLMDENGFMYYGLIGLNEFDRWEDRSPITTFKSALGAQEDNSDQVFFEKNSKFAWIDSLCIDNSRNLYMLSNNYHKFLTNANNITEINIRILRTGIGGKSYLHNKNITNIKSILDAIPERYRGRKRIECKRPIKQDQPICLCY